MDPGTIIIIILRLIVPFAILRRPLGGFAASLVLDILHAPIVYLINLEAGYGSEPLLEYHAVDKPLDLYFLCFAFLASSKWQNPLAKKTAFFLFWLRAAGIALFTVTGLRPLFFFFPNLFELFYIYYLTLARWFSGFGINSLKKLLIVLVPLILFQLLREYLLHVQDMGFAEMISHFTPFELDTRAVWEMFFK